jgi:hypothetical protein
MNLIIRLFFALFFFLPTLVSAQVPPAGLEGVGLRNWIKVNFYDGEHTNLGYSTARRRMFNYIDNHNDTVYCVYGGLAKYVPYGGTVTYPAPFNTEHTVPQAFFNENEPMRSDIHHLFPTYEQWNSNRASHPFAEIDDNQTSIWMRLNQSQSSIPGNLIDEYSESWGSQFEAREDHKGNLARAVFYFFTMYPTQAGNISQLGNLNTLYQWHQQDPPDAAEVLRNDGVETYQGNRNPYIDHPNWVGPAWGFGTSAPAVPTGLTVVADTNRLLLQWDDLPSETGYLLFRSTDNASFAKLDSFPENTVSYEDQAVTGGLTYFYYLIGTNAAGNGPASPTVSAAPIPGLSSGGFANDLLISEYIEGDLFNKALEIANGTGEVVDLSAYSLKKQLNGFGPWGDEVALSGNLSDGDVWVIASEAASQVILAQADLASTSNLMIFNGNDPLGLFKNGNLIDIVGELDGGTNVFGANVTLRRKIWVVAPSEVYLSNQWESLPTNNSENLGVHSFDPSANSVAAALSIPGLQIWPNPVADYLVLESTQLPHSQLQCLVYDMRGRIISAQTEVVDGQQLRLNTADWQPGLYLLQVISPQGRQGFRVVKQ